MMKQGPSWMDVWTGRQRNRRSGKAKWGRLLCNHLEQGHWRGELFQNIIQNIFLSKIIQNIILNKVIDEVSFSKTFHPSLKILSLAMLGALYLTHHPIQTSIHIHLRWWIDPALKSQMMFCLFQDFASTLTLGARLDRNPALWGVRGLHILRGLHIFGRLIRILLNIWTFYECFQRCPFLQTLVLLPPLYWTTRREHS